MPSETTFDVDYELRLRNAMPTGPPGENHPARPNILMFGDWCWQGDRTGKQEGRFSTFRRNSLQKGVPFVVIEIGAGNNFRSDYILLSELSLMSFTYFNFLSYMNSIFVFYCSNFLDNNACYFRITLSVSLCSIFCAVLLCIVWLLVNM